MKISRISIATIIATTLSVLSGCAQSNTDFKTFVNFFPQRDYPLILSYDDNAAFGITLPSIPETLFKKYIFQKDYFLIKENEKICFSGFLAEGKFSTNESYQLLLVGKDSETSGCGEESWLTTYSTQGEIIDVLFVFGRSTNYKNTTRIPFTVESMITADSISIRREETIRDLIKVNDKEYKSTYKAYNRVYHISTEGKFILDKEVIKEEERYLK